MWRKKRVLYKGYRLGSPASPRGLYSILEPKMGRDRGRLSDMNSVVFIFFWGREHSIFRED